MLNTDDINLTEPQPALNEWLVRCHIFPDTESALTACRDLERLTSLRRVPYAEFSEPGKLVTRGFMEISDDAVHALITPLGISFYSSLQAWLRTWRRNNNTQEVATP